MLLLAVAADQFIERGYEAVSMQDIADRAHLTKGALYGHFRSKGQLLVEVLRWKLSEHDQELDTEELTIDRGIKALGATNRADLRLLEVDAAAAARHDHDVERGLAEMHGERLEQIALTAADLPDPEAAAWLVAVIEGGIGMSEATGTPRPDRDRVEAVLIAALSGVYLGLDAGSIGSARSIES
jgi:AcrR family transcriptional regulator